MSLSSPSAAIGTDSVRQAIAVVFRQPEYRRSFRRTLWQEIVERIGEIFRSIGSAMETYPQLKWATIAAAIAVASLVIGRIAYAKRMGLHPSHRKLGDTRASGFQDPWSAAQNAALAGNYLEAAHALYFAVLEAIAGSDRVVIDSAKTVGDYSRDLRRSSSRALPLFRDFAKVYEPIVWGSRDCDQSRFEQLSGIASRLTGRSR